MYGPQLPKDHPVLLLSIYYYSYYLIIGIVSLIGITIVASGAYHSIIVVYLQPVGYSVFSFLGR